MKKVLGIFLAIVLMPAAQVQAWIGGPFSNNSYGTSGDDGIYEAIATVTDGLGMYRWAVSNNQTGGNGLSFAGGFGTSNVSFGGLAVAQAPHIWYYRGVTYYGQCFGTANSALNRVTVIGNASDSGVDGADIPLNGVNLTGGTSGQGTQNQAGGNAFGEVGILATGSANRKSFCNSNFTATFDASKTEYTYVKRFKGKGTITFYGLPDQAFVLVDTVLFDPPNDISQVDVSIGNNDDTFTKIGHSRVINVFGSRVSQVVTGGVVSGN